MKFLRRSYQFAMSYAQKLGLQVDWSDFSATTSKLAVMTQRHRRSSTSQASLGLLSFITRVPFTTLKEGNRQPFPARSSLVTH